MAFVGIDSKKIIRYGRFSDFIAVIGIAINVENYDEFKKKYSEVISNLLIKRGIKPSKIVYKSYDLINLGIDEEFYEEFFDAIKDDIKELHIFYSYFPQKESSGVTITPFDKLKKISFIEFIKKHLDPYYPHVCLWELSKNGFDGFYYLDNFNGRVTDAWREIASLNNFSIWPNGDRVNSLISSADILITFLDKKLYKNKKRLKDQEILEVFDRIKDKVCIYFISNACLYSIIPLSEREFIPTTIRYKHPIIYILKEKSEFVEEKAIENSPLLKKIINKCFNENWCFKFFDFQKDYEVLTEEDFILSFGEKGDESIKHLKNLGYKFKSLKMEDLKTKDL